MRVVRVHLPDGPVAVEARRGRLGVDGEPREDGDQGEPVEEPHDALDASLRVARHFVDRVVGPRGVVRHAVETRRGARTWIGGEDRAEVNYCTANALEFPDR